MTAETQEPLDIREKGRGPGGEPIASDRRLFMQLLAFGDSRDTARLIHALEEAAVCAALYEDVNDSWGVGLLLISEDPEYFISMRALLNRPPFAELTPKPEYTTLGR